MHDNKSEIESGETIEYKPKTLFNLNDFMENQNIFCIIIHLEIHCKICFPKEINLKSLF